MGVQQPFLIVRWDEQEAGFCLYDTRNARVREYFEQHEVIGNIYEDPYFKSLAI